MFTGIVEETGKIVSVKKGLNSSRIIISAKKVLSDTETGDSIAVNGVCLTVDHMDRDSFTADVMHETMKRSSLGFTAPGSYVNLERAMRLGDRLGGHIVSGHIDGMGIIEDIKKDDNAYWYRIGCDSRILGYIIEKGSVAIDGISLTVAAVDENSFSVSVIPHTMENTVLRYRKTGERVNLENDCIGKYVEKILGRQMVREEKKRKENIKKTPIDREFLAENGFLQK